MAIAEIRNNQFNEPLGAYAVGFFDSALGILERANAHRGLPDLAVYPAFYCVRHGLELFIKQMSIFAAYSHADAARLYTKVHPLEESWNTVASHVTGCIDELRYSQPREEIAGLQHHAMVIEETVRHFHTLDPDGTLFRYPEDVRVPKSGARSRRGLPPPFDFVDLENWAGIAGDNLAAAQALLWLVRENAEHSRRSRQHPSELFHELVLRYYQHRTDK